MAKSYLTLVSLGFFLLLVLLLLVAGCQVPNSSVGQIPPPNFNGPIVLAAGTRPQIIRCRRTRRFAPAVATAGIPKSWIPYATPRNWKWIVIHHSATRAAGRSCSTKCTSKKGGTNSAITSSSATAQTRPTGRSKSARGGGSRNGAPCEDAEQRIQRCGIGICLVGNFDVERPTPEQMQSLARLMTYLMKTYNIRPQDVIGHGETKPTDCPGRFINVAAFRRKLAQGTADANDGLPDSLETNPALISEPRPAAAQVMPPVDHKSTASSADEKSN